MPGAADGTITVDSRIDPKGFNTGIASMTNSLKGLAAAIGIAFSLNAIVNFGKQALQAGSDMNEMLNRFKVGFGSMADEVKAQFSDIANSTNRASDDLMDIGAGFQNMLFGMGVANQEASRISVAATKWAVDMGSFWNVDQVKAADTLKSALVGYTRGLREFGITVTAADIKNKAYSMGLAIVGDKLSSTAQAQAILALVTDKAKNAMGDAAATSGSWANQVRGIQAAWQDFMQTVGTALIPLLLQITPIIRQIISWMTGLVDIIARLMASIFGTAATTRTLAGSTSEMADSIGEGADSSGTLAKNLEKAKKSSSGVLADFDVIHKLPSSSTPSAASSAGPGGTGAGGGFDLPVPDVGPVKGALAVVDEEIQKIKAQFLTFLDPLFKAFDRLKIALQPLGKTIWDGLKWAWDNILVPFGAWVIQDALPAFLDLLGAAALALNSALVALKPFGVWLWENFLKPAADWTGKAIIDGLKFITDTLTNLSLWIDKNQDQFKNITIVVGIVVIAFFALAAIVSIAWGVFLSLVGVLVSLVPFVLELVGLIGSSLVIAIGAVILSVIGMAVQIVVSIALWVAAIIGLILFWPKISAAASAAVENVKKFWAGVGEWFRINVTDKIMSFFAPLFSWIGIVAHDTWAVVQFVWGIAALWFQAHFTKPIQAGLAQAWFSIQNGINSVWASVTTTLGNLSTFLNLHVVIPIKNMFSDAWKSISTGFINAFTPVGLSIKNIINGIIDSMNGLILGMATGINSMISSANQMGSVVPGWINIPNVSAAQIPHLATGGIIPPNNQFLAVLGDQRSGTNIEAPAKMIEDIVTRAVAAGQGNQKMTVTFDGRWAPLIQELFTKLEIEKQRRGTTLLSGGQI